MNNFSGIGRLTRKPEIYRNDDSVSAKFTIAIDRRFKNKDGNYDADFPSCVAFGKTAEFIEKYFDKGMKIGIRGSIRTGKYTNKEGQTVYTTDILVDEAEFVESKAASENGRTSAPPPMAPSPVPTPQTPPPVYNAPPMPQQQAPQPQYQQYAQQPQYQPQYQQQPYYQQPQQGQPLPDFVTVPPNSPDEIPFP